MRRIERFALFCSGRRVDLMIAVQERGSRLRSLLQVVMKEIHN